MPNLQMSLPPASDIADWVMLLREVRFMDLFEMIAVHQGLHDTFGEEPSDAVLEGEKELSFMLRRIGIEHRHQDELSRAAGTLVENPAPPTLEEVSLFLQDIVAQSGAIRLVQNVEEPGPVFVRIDNVILPASMNAGILKSLQKMMPPGIELEPLPGAAPDGENFARELPAFDLALKYRTGPIMVTPWQQLIAEAPEAIAKAFKEGSDGKQQQLRPSIVKREEVVFKGGEGLADTVEQFVLAAVLKPETEDSQGEIYSKDEVRKACHWWAEHSGSFSQRHVMQGGRACSPGEVVLLENFVMPMDCTISGEFIPEGSWMLGSGIRNDQIWRDIIAGRLNAYSIGAEALVFEEEVPVAA